MFCRCRYLRAYHLESLLPAALPSIPTHCVPRNASITRNFSDSPSPHHSNTVWYDKDGNAFNSLAGSIRSPLAFKPLPPATRDTPFSDGADLEPEPDEEEPPPSVTLQPNDSPFPGRRRTAGPEPPDTTEDTGDVEELDSTDPKDLNAYASLPWVDYVRQVKVVKLRQQKAKERSSLNSARAIQQRDRIRTRGRSRVANLSVLRLVLLARAGCQLSEPSVLYNFSVGLVDSCTKSPRARASMVVRVLQMLVPRNKKKYPNHPTFDALLRPWDQNRPALSEAEATFHKNVDNIAIDLFSKYCQDKPDFVAEFPRDAIFRLVTVVARRRPQALTHGGLLNTFFAAARQGGLKLSHASPSQGPTLFDNPPTGHLWALFRLVQVHINSKSQREAFRLFQRLVKEKMITTSAISQANIDQGDPRTVILFAMTRTCLDYEWTTGALELMNLAASCDPAVFDEQTKTLVNQSLHVLLKQAALVSPAQGYSVRMSAAVQQGSSQQDLAGPRFLLRRIVALITALRRDQRVFEIEDRIIQQFYALARQLESQRAAESLFSIGRIYTPSSISAPPMLVSPSFEIPDGSSHGRVLPVEPRHMTFRSAPEPTLPSQEAQPTAASEAATVNTKYPLPHGPALLWLFETTLKESKNIHLCRHLANEIADSNIDIPVYDRGKFIRLVANAGFAQAARKLWERYSEDESQGVIGHVGAMTRLVSLFCQLSKDLEAKEAMVNKGLDVSGHSSISSSGTVFPGGGGNAEMVVISGEDATDPFDVNVAKGFAKEVVDKFRASKVPLEHASQEDLNGLARAYFMMDRAEEGFELFRILKGIRSPDLHDVNVVLSGIAEYNVGLASTMIDRMHERGLVPDMVTWGTVIHLAFLKGDMELMISLVKRAQEQGISRLSARTIGTLIRASVSNVPPGSQLASHAVTLGSKERVGLLQLIFGGEGGAEQIRRNLDAAWHLIGTLDPQSFVGTGSLAKFCLDRALWVGDAELAFRFWEQYLSSKTEWNDPGQAEFRKRLRKSVRMAKAEGKLEPPQATDMLRKLFWTGRERKSVS